MWELRGYPATLTGEAPNRGALFQMGVPVLVFRDRRRWHSAGSWPYNDTDGNRAVLVCEPVVWQNLEPRPLLIYRVDRAWEHACIVGAWTRRHWYTHAWPDHLEGGTRDFYTLPLRHAHFVSIVDLI